MPPVNLRLIRHLSEAAKLSAIPLEDIWSNSPLPSSRASCATRSQYIPLPIIYASGPHMPYGAFMKGGI